MTAPAAWIEHTPSTSRKALALGYKSQYPVWLALKQYDRGDAHGLGSGTGRFVVDEEALAFLCELLDTSPRRVKDILKGEAGPFWTCEVTPQGGPLPDILFVRLTGQKRVDVALANQAAAAGLEQPRESSRNKAKMSAQAFRSLASFSAACFADWIASHKDRQLTIPQALLERLWGRSKRQIYTWMNMAGVGRQQNVGEIDLTDGETLREEIARVELEETNGATWSEHRRDGSTWFCFQRCNTYTAPDSAASGRRGYLRKAAAHIRQGGENSRHVRTNHRIQGKGIGRQFRKLRAAIDGTSQYTHYLHDRELVTFGGPVVHRWVVCHLGVNFA